MRRRVRRLVEIDNAVLDVVRQWPLQRRVAGGKRSVVAGTDVEFVVVFEKNRPLRSVDGGSEALRLYQEISGGVVFFFIGLAALLLLRLLGMKELDVGHGDGGGIRVLELEYGKGESRVLERGGRSCSGLGFWVFDEGEGVVEKLLSTLRRMVRCVYPYCFSGL